MIWVSLDVPSTLIPTLATNPDGAWIDWFNATGYPANGTFAYSNNDGHLVLRNCSGYFSIPSDDAIIGIEVELYGKDLAGIFSEDTFTASSGTLLRNHNGETNADWQKHTTGYDPADLAINSLGRLFYTFSNASGFTSDGSEHFLSNDTAPDADYSVQAEFHAMTDAEDEKVEIYARATQPYQFYILSYTQDGAGAGTWKLEKQTIVSDRSTLDSYAGDVIDVGSYKTARLEVIGTAIKGYVDGVERVSSTDSTITGAGYGGIRIDEGLLRQKVTVTALYDLGSATTVTRFRRRYGWVNNEEYPYVIEASNDGVTWVNAYTTPKPIPPAPTGSFQWVSEQDETFVTSTPYRYWRTVIRDPGTTDTEARIGDFRLYTSSGIIDPSTVDVRGGAWACNNPHNWDEATETTAFTDNSPGDNTTWIGDTWENLLGVSGLQLDNFKILADSVESVEVALTKNGYDASTEWKELQISSTNSYAILGGSTDLWNSAWTVGDVKKNLFGVLFRRKSSNSQPFIDASQVKIYHTYGGGDMARRESVRQQVLIGRQSTFGTGVSADTRLRFTNIGISPDIERQQHTPAGEKLNDKNCIIKEHTTGPIQGIATYDEIGYLFASSVAMPQSTEIESGVAYRHIFGLDNRVKDNIAHYTHECGDYVSRAHKAVDMIVNALELSIRQDGIDLSGNVFAGKLEDGITMSNGVATVQTLTQSGSGTFTLVFRGEETAALTAGASLTASAVQTALRDLGVIASSTELTVSGSDGGPFTITFGNDGSGPFKGIPQPIIGYRTVTGTPTVSVAMTTAGGFTTHAGACIVPRHCEIFLTDTLANIASSKLVAAFASGFSIGGRANPVFDLDRSNESFFDFVEPADMTVQAKVVAEANATNMGFLANARNGDTLYLRILFTGPTFGGGSTPYKLQIDMPVTVGGEEPYSDNQGVHSYGYNFDCKHNSNTNESLVITLDNDVASYA